MEVLSHLNLDQMIEMNIELDILIFISDNNCLIYQNKIVRVVESEVSYETYSLNFRNNMKLKVFGCKPTDKNKGLT